MNYIPKNKHLITVNKFILTIITIIASLLPWDI